MPIDEPDLRMKADQIAEQLVAVMTDSYGTSAGSTEVLVSENTIVVFFDDLELHKSEEFLIESGEGDKVVDIRHRYQAAIQSTYVAVVERTTGRRVLSFSSSTKLDPNYAVEVFRLAPSG